MDSIDYIISDISIKENIDIDLLIPINSARLDSLRILINLHEYHICDDPIDAEMSFDKDLRIFKWIEKTYNARIKWYVGPTVIIIFPSLERKAEFLFKFG